MSRRGETMAEEMNKYEAVKQWPLIPKLRGQFA